MSVTPRFDLLHLQWVCACAYAPLCAGLAPRSAFPDSLLLASQASAATLSSLLWVLSLTQVLLSAGQAFF